MDECIYDFSSHRHNDCANCDNVKCLQNTIRQLVREKEELKDKIVELWPKEEVECGSCKKKFQAFKIKCPYSYGNLTQHDTCKCVICGSKTICLDCHDYFGVKEVCASCIKKHNLQC